MSDNVLDVSELLLLGGNKKLPSPMNCSPEKKIIQIENNVFPKILVVVFYIISFIRPIEVFTQNIPILACLELT